MEITKKYLECMKEIALRNIERVSSERPKNSLDRKALKLELAGLTGQVLILDSLIGYIDKN